MVRLTYLLSQRGHSRQRALKWEEYRAALILLAPAFIGLLIFAFAPIVLALQVSFYQAPLLSAKRTFTGWENYREALADAVFGKAMLTTVTYTVGMVVAETLLALALALLLSRSMKGIGFLRTAYFLPVVTSLVVVSTVWKLMYYTDNGLINSVLRAIGLSAQPWLTSGRLALWSIVILGVWKEIGFSMLVLLGGIQTIPVALYEASALDGATGWSRFRRITLPLLRRPLLFVVSLTTINAFKVFTPIYVMTDGGPSDSTRTTVYYIFQTGFRYNQLGYAAALSFLLLVVIAVFMVVQFRLLHTDVEY